MKEFFPGDLVRYIGKVTPVELRVPVVPPNRRPYGMVLEVKEFKLGGDPMCAATMHVVMVNWFDKAWNTDGASHSEEVISDLELVQRCHSD